MSAVSSKALYQIAQEENQSLIFLGCSNAGKSSFINRILISSKVRQVLLLSL